MNSVTRRNVLKGASMLATVAAISGAPSLTFAAAPKQHFQSPGFYRIALGDLEITALSDGTLPLPLPEMYRDVTAEQAAQLLRAAFRHTPPAVQPEQNKVHAGAKVVERPTPGFLQITDQAKADTNR